MDGNPHLFSENEDPLLNRKYDGKYQMFSDKLEVVLSNCSFPKFVGFVEGS